MVDRNDRQDAVMAELSREEIAQVQGGGTDQIGSGVTATIDLVETSSESYQGKRSTGGYVPT